MRAFSSTLVQQERFLPGIHGLRGIAALAVVLFHLVHVGGIKTPIFLECIGRDFGFGVHLFFILSAFSLMHSTGPRIYMPGWLSQYFIKRFFRIAPLFYFMLALWLAVGLIKGTGAKDPIGIFLNLTFTFGFIPQSGIVWGGWSVGVEMIFYAVFPVALLLIRSHKSALVLLVLSILATTALRAALHDQYMALDPAAQFDWSYFSFPSNMCFFVMGIYVYQLGKLSKAYPQLPRVWAPLAATVILGALLGSDLGPRLYNSARWDIVLWGGGLSALCAWQGWQPSGAISSRPFQYFGERSYSIYLVHPVVLHVVKGQVLKLYEWCAPAIGAYSFFVCAGVAVSAVLVCAEATFRLIEVPGIRLGRKMLAMKRFQAVKTALSLEANEYHVPAQVRIRG